MPEQRRQERDAPTAGGDQPRVVDDREEQRVGAGGQVRGVAEAQHGALPGRIAAAAAAEGVGRMVQIKVVDLKRQSLDVACRR